MFSFVSQFLRQGHVEHDARHVERREQADDEADVRLMPKPLS